MKTTISQLGKIRQLLTVLLCSITCFGVALDVIAQESVLSVTRLSPKQDDKQKSKDESTEPLFAPKRPVNCESFWSFVDDVIIRWQEMKGTSLIVIARLGEHERASNLSKSRLSNIEGYLNNTSDSFLIEKAQQINGFSSGL